MRKKEINSGLNLLKVEFGEARVKAAIKGVKEFKVEIPSWIFGAFGGGRFGEYTPPGCARNIIEKVDDAAYIKSITEATDSVAVHILWDMTEDGVNGSYSAAKKLAAQMKKRKLKMGSISPTYFLKGSQRGSVTADEKKTRDRYVAQTVLGGKIAKDFGTKLLTIWLPDGSLYPGQVDLARAYENMKVALVQASRKISKSVKILIEYKVFEPGTYSTAISDWGTSYLLCKSIGANAGVLVDLGHHSYGTNIEQIVARLIKEKMYCGFHFNTRYAADDDHSVEPNAEMARIFNELVNGEVIVNKVAGKNWAYMIDQCSGRENRLQAILHSIDSLQNSLAKALLLDRSKLAKYQKQDEVILANRTVNDALINADVRPVVAKAREEKGMPVDPIEIFVSGGYQKKIEKERR